MTDLPNPSQADSKFAPSKHEELPNQDVGTCVFSMEKTRIQGGGMNLSLLACSRLKRLVLRCSS
jgi:hypothetical protein